ncbi:protein ECERIFERUM 26-like [Vitis riparia]|uniref:protein ECERIFERUM 26-like n=1 Tax=Vitis riparia TaxID=96939 RepID=UPI00155B09FF|nr:protein ECERIFERUM 26-like [Vitis riparia]
MADISYICKRTVVSTKPVQPGKTHPLSALDRAMEHNRVRIVYYYRTPPGREVGEVTKRLRETISEMLTSFPMVTGRLQRNEEGQWVVKCNDAGVRMVEARAKGSVGEWLKSVDREKELKLVHWEDMFHKIYFWSTFYVQLTEFAEGGLAIGFSCTHLLADPICATMIIKAWADTSLLGEMPNPPLFHSSLPLIRPVNSINHNPYTHLINHYKSSLDNSTPVTNTKYTTIALLFTNPTVQACMEMARTHPEAHGTPIFPSPFEALAGLLWTCISNVKGRREGLINMSICLDMRKILGLDEGFFGNCMVYNSVHGGDFNGHEISKAAMAIRGVMEKMDSEGIMDLIQWLECNSDRFSVLMGGCDHLICTNLEDVEPYSAMFEEGYAPVRVSYHMEPVSTEGQVLILPAPPEEGPLSRVVMVTLPENEAVKLCKDVLVLSFSPTILMGFNKN